MESRQLFVVALVLCASALGASGQIHGLPVADAPGSQGDAGLSVAPCILLTDSSSMYGGHLAYNVGERLLLFVDIGSYKTEHAPAETMGQAGLRYRLPLELPVNLSVRATTVPYIASFEYYVELTLGLLASREFGQDLNWSVYGGVGVVFQQWELELALSEEQAALTGQSTYTDIGEQTDASFVIGVTRRMYGSASCFLEVAYVDDLFGGVGIQLGL